MTAVGRSWCGVLAVAIAALAGGCGQDDDGVRDARATVTSANQAARVARDPETRVDVRLGDRDVTFDVTPESRAGAVKSAGAQVTVLCGVGDPAVSDSTVAGKGQWPVVGERLRISLPEGGERPTFCVVQTEDGGDISCVRFDEPDAGCYSSGPDAGRVTGLTTE